MQQDEAAVIARRRRRGSNGPNDVATLVTALGGDASVAAIYDTRYGVTTATGVSQWADARGSSGFGPSMVQATGANQPTWDGALLTMTSDGVSKQLISALSPKFDISGAVTLVYVGSFVSGNGICCLRNDVTTPLMKITNTSAIAGTVFGSAGSDLTSTVSVSTTRRVTIVRKGAGANTNTTQVPNIAQQGPGNGSVCAAGDRAVAVGSSAAAAAEFGVGTWRAVIVINHATSGAEDTAIKNWAVTYHAAVLA